MSHAIIVSTAPGMEPWLDQCLKSLRPVTGIPVIIYRNTLGTCEGESLRQAALYTQYDEVIFLHDTMELLDPRLIDYCFTEHAGKSIGFMGGLDFGMNSGKFKPAVLRQMRETVLRIPKDKQDAADMELEFGAEYQRYEPEAFVMPDPLLDRPVFERRSGKPLFAKMEGMLEPSVGRCVGRTESGLRWTPLVAPGAGMDFSALCLAARARPDGAESAEKSSVSSRGVTIR